MLFVGFRTALRCMRSKDDATFVIGLGCCAGFVHLCWEMWWDIQIGGTAPYLFWFMLGLLQAAVAIETRERAHPAWARGGRRWRRVRVARARCSRMKSPAADVTRNAAVLTLLRIASPAIAMIVVLGVSRVLGSEGLGRYTLASTYLAFVTTVTPLGLNAF